MDKCENTNCDNCGTIGNCCAEYDDISECNDATFTLQMEKTPMNKDKLIKELADMLNKMIDEAADGYSFDSTKDEAGELIKKAQKEISA